MIDHKFRRGLKIVKNLKDYDFSNVHYAIIANSTLKNFHNRYNINSYKTVINMFNESEYQTYSDIVARCEFGGIHLIGIKIGKPQEDKLKFIIKWRLKNYYGKEL